MSDDKTKDKGKNGDNTDKPKATDKELGELVKAQAKRIEQLETDATTSKGLKDEVAKLQETLGTQTSLTELVEQLKTMNADNPAQTEAEKHLSELTQAAESGNMKEFRRLRQEQA